MKRFISVPLMGLLLSSLVFITQTHATSYNFSYIFNLGGLITGMLDGDVRALDANIVDVTAVTMMDYTQTILDGGATIPMSISPISSTVVSFDGTDNVFAVGAFSDTTTIFDMNSAGFALVELGGAIVEVEFTRPLSWSLTAKQPAPIPEPNTIILLSTGLLGLAGYRWHQRRREGTQVG